MTPQTWTLPSLSFLPNASSIAIFGDQLLLSQHFERPCTPTTTPPILTSHGPAQTYAATTTSLHALSRSSCPTLCAVQPFFRHVSISSTCRRYSNILRAFPATANSLIIHADLVDHITGSFQNPRQMILALLIKPTLSALNLIPWR